jgi:ABC-type transport system involved in multi-copper enzyme maturation permease subunit
VLASVAGVALLAAAMLWFAVQLRMLVAAEPGCPDPHAYVPGCEAFVQRFQGMSGWAQGLLYLSWGAPFGMGLVLGVPIVAREVEGRTAGMTWTLSRSRARWLAGRIAFAALVLVALLAIVVLASGQLAAAIVPNLQLERDFTWIGRRDWLIVARGLAALGIGALVGTLVGRQLPGLLAAGFASVLLFTGMSLAMDRWNETLAIITDPYATPDGFVDGSLGLGGAIELPSGELVPYAEITADEQYQDETGAIYTRWDEETGQADPDSFVGWDRVRIIPGQQYQVVLARDSGVTLGVGMVVIGGSLVAVVRRRPA